MRAQFSYGHNKFNIKLRSMPTVNNQTSKSRPAATELMPAATKLRQEVAVATSTPTTRADDKPDWEVERRELENCSMEPGKIKIKMVLHDDLISQILLWLPVRSLLRLKYACRLWRALIESSYFIKQHLHRHHYDPSLKDKNHNLIYLLRGKNSSITFTSTSSEGFEEPNVCLQLNYSVLDVDFPVREVVSYNGIICLSLINCKGEQNICLWNPATKKSRVLPQSTFPGNISLGIGFGYDIKSNDYKVVELIRGAFAEKRFVEVYSLNRSSWKRSTTVFPFGFCYENPSMPFNNGTCFFWGYTIYGNSGIFCFDLSSEMFRSISLPPVDCNPLIQCRMSVVHDKIACVIDTKDNQTEMWVFNEYGTVNESWTKLYTVNTYRIIDGLTAFKGVSMDGNYIFFKRMEQMCRFNVVTKETNCFTLKNMSSSIAMTLVGFKESLVSVEEGNNAPICIDKDSGNQK